mmetsp:Transcript_37891/g.92911  ORF Transcript_37891/g.92911 Transcript_37891/m.92911 type:complete len:211 (+) Transcript_37891:829-1461(+)
MRGNTPHNCVAHSVAVGQGQNFKIWKLRKQHQQRRLRHEAARERQLLQSPSKGRHCVALHTTILQPATFGQVQDFERRQGRTQSRKHAAVHTLHRSHLQGLEWHLHRSQPHHHLRRKVRFELSTARQMHSLQVRPRRGQITLHKSRPRDGSLGQAQVSQVGQRLQLNKPLVGDLITTVQIQLPQRPNVRQSRQAIIRHPVTPTQAQFSQR